jgi:hypothetical protein
MSQDQGKTITDGDVITYTLRPDQRPINPNKEYRGIVKKVYAEAQMLMVTLLTPGYEGMEEPVYVSQVKSVAKRPSE